MKPWIIITITGTTAGAFVGSLTYTAATHTSDLVAAGTGLGIHAIGTAGSYLASALIGDMAGVSVRVATQVAGHLTQETIKTNGRVAAGLLGATSAALTAFTFTAGSHVIKYTLEYGGLITEQLAKKIAEEYIRFQTDQNGFNDNVADTGWVIIDDETDSDEVSKPVTGPEPELVELRQPQPSIFPIELPNVLSPQ